MERARFFTQTIDSTMIGHNGKVGLLFHCPLFCLCLSLVCSLLPLGPSILFSLCLSLSFPRTLTNYLRPVSGDGRVSIPSGRSFLSNKMVRWAVFLVLFALIFQACISPRIPHYELYIEGEEWFQLTFVMVRIVVFVSVGLLLFSSKKIFG